MNVLAYPAKDGRNLEVLKAINEGNYTIDGLRKKFGISPSRLKRDYGAKSNGRGRPKKPKPVSEPKKLGRPPKAVPILSSPAVSEASFAPTQPNPKKVHFPQPSAPRPLDTLFIGLGFILLSLIGQAVGGWINWHYGYSFGGNDPIVSFACGMIGLVVDGGAWLWLPGARALWRKGNYFWSLIAFLAWLPFLGGSTYAALGFVGVHVGDVLQARGSVPELREGLIEQKERAKADRRAILEISNPDVLENQMNLALGSVPRKNRDSSKDCTEPTLSAAYCADYVRLKGAYTAAKARVELDKTIDDLTAKIAALPAVGSKNPAADQLAQITYGRINPEQAGNYQIRWLGIVPGFSSIMLTIGLALCRRT